MTSMEYLVTHELRTSLMLRFKRLIGAEPKRVEFKIIFPVGQNWNRGDLVIAESQIVKIVKKLN